MTDCQREFEKWYVNKCGSTDYLQKFVGGKYIYYTICERWAIWQAAWQIAYDFRGNEDR